MHFLLLQILSVCMSHVGILEKIAVLEEQLLSVFVGFFFNSSLSFFEPPICRWSTKARDRTLALCLFPRATSL